MRRSHRDLRPRHQALHNARRRALLRRRAGSRGRRFSALLARLPSPVAQSRKPAFAFLKRKRPGSAVPDGSAEREHEPLAEMAENVGVAAAEKAGSRKRKGKLTQMQIDLGGEVRKACKTYGMDYIPSNAEDAGLHQKFHAMNVGGVGMRKGCLREMKKRRVVDVGERRLGEGHAVVVVDGRGSSSVRYEAKRVLEVVNTELSAVGIEDKELWGQAPGPVTSKGKSVLRRGKDKSALMGGGDRFKVYL
ncbi:N-acetyltransferase ESCO, zinc-finger [Lasallia pustulata]|uniref:N-acetyltransferase ESCO, zinc-finger n=1 Tax=Lasallia pustulata TaxID=136370 RepID=A0A1W5D3P6_9LECA|nr:N-acetyltransferase ESCO, zinc-finger [Lasallia pustulata]